MVPASPASAKAEAQRVVIREKVDDSIALALGASETWTIAKYIDTLDWVSGSLVVRVHALALASGASLSCALQNVSYAPDEPGTIFAGGDTASIAIAGTAPLLLLGGIGAPIGAYNRCQLRYSQGSSSSATSTFTLSIEIVGRDA